MSLADDIQAELEKGGKKANPCTVCVAILATEDEVDREALREAAAGKLSRSALVRISQKRNLGMGQRSITKHRNEGHKP